MRIVQIISIAAALTLSGCAAHFGAIKSDVSLNQANFKVTGTAAGSAQAKLVMGFGGLNKETLVADARRDLISKAKLSSDQVLANIAMDMKTTFYPGFLPIVVIQKVTLTADIVEFTK
jgi:hypothetical protein